MFNEFIPSSDTASRSRDRPNHEAKVHRSQAPAPRQSGTSNALQLECPNSSVGVPIHATGRLASELNNYPCDFIAFFQVSRQLTPGA